jgi:outer membrane immunogenic protein
MRRTLFALFGLVGISVAASAADLPSARYAPVAPIVPVFTWTGFYIGVNAGVAWQDQNNDAIFVPPGTFGPGTGNFFVSGVGGNNDAVFTGGGQIGYNYQAGGWVFGIEADLQWADMNNNNNFNTGFVAVGLPAGFVFASANNGLEWWGTVRGRVGFAWDRALLYATGGFAFGGGGGNNNTFCGVAFGCGGGDDTRTGWTVGGGLEYAFTNNWTVKIEGLYVNLDGGGSNNGLLGFVNGVPVFLPPGFVTNRVEDNTFGVVRVGLNYKF